MALARLRTMTASTMTPPLPSAAELDALRAAVRADLPAYLADLERLVNIDCGSYTPDGVNEVGRWVAEFLTGLGAEVETHPDPAGRLGDTLIATFNGRTGGARAVLIGHMDTVFDPGTVAERPFRIEDGVAYGPGVTDMKGGLLAGLYALKAIMTERGGLPFERLVFIANPDEEIGSPTSTPHIQAQAAETDVAPRARMRPRQRRHRVGAQGHPRPADRDPWAGGPRRRRTGEGPQRDPRGGAHRRGAARPQRALARGDRQCRGDRRRDAAQRRGRAVHARGRRPGHHARGARGGRRPPSAGIAEATEIPDITVDFEPMARWWPMERLERSARLVEHAQGVAELLGFSVADASTGGASDANSTSGMGIPSLDGLGPIGGNDHSPAEYLDVDSIVPRTTLVAGLLLAIAADPEVLAWRERPDGRRSPVPRDGGERREAPETANEAPPAEVP